jgi:hypothetical protein
MLTFPRVLFAGVLLFAPPAFGACAQPDLTGVWRLNFNVGANHVSNSRTDQSSCLIDISNTGVVTPQQCASITGEVQTASITNNSPSRLLRVNPQCEAKLRGDIVFGNDWNLTIGPISYFVNGLQLTMSPSKDVMIGFASLINGANTSGVASIMAVKKVP